MNYKPAYINVIFAIFVFHFIEKNTKISDPYRVVRPKYILGSLLCLRHDLGIKTFSIYFYFHKIMFWK